MALNRAVATRPGQDTLVEPLSAAEEAARIAESDAEAEATLRRGLRVGLIDEAVKRIAAQVPEWDTFERIALLASVWNMFGAPNAAQALARDIYLYARDTAIPKIPTLTLIQAQSVDPTAAKPFATADPADPGWPV